MSVCVIVASVSVPAGAHVERRAHLQVVEEVGRVRARGGRAWTKACGAGLPNMPCDHGVEARLAPRALRAAAGRGRAVGAGERRAAQRAERVTERAVAAGGRRGHAVERIAVARRAEGVDRAVEPQLRRIERAVGEIAPGRGERRGRRERRGDRERRRRDVGADGIGTGVDEGQGDLHGPPGTSARPGRSTQPSARMPPRLSSARPTIA